MVAQVGSVVCKQLQVAEGAEQAQRRARGQVPVSMPVLGLPKATKPPESVGIVPTPDYSPATVRANEDSVFLFALGADREDHRDLRRSCFVLPSGRRAPFACASEWADLNPSSFVLWWEAGYRNSARRGQRTVLKKGEDYQSVYRIELKGKH